MKKLLISVFTLVFVFYNGAFAQGYVTQLNSDQGIKIFIDNDNSHTGEDMVWIFDRSTWNDGDNTETMRLNKSRLALSANLNANRVAIGTTNFNGQLQFKNDLVSRKIVLNESANNDHQFSGFGINSYVLRYQTGNIQSDHVFFAGTSASSSTELMRIKGGGQVGIGVPNDRFEPGCKLAVNGATYIGDFGVGYQAGFVQDSLLDHYMLWVEKGIVTEDLAIAHVGAWSDYVFEEDYKLPTLPELESFIKTNKHLPAIPSEKEVKENGYSQHKLNNGFLKTIEELSLYIINQDKQIADLQEQVKSQQTALQEIKDNAKKVENLALELENMKRIINDILEK